jgi:putative membrane protein
MKTRNVLIGIGIALALVALVGGGWLLGSQLWGTGCWQSGFGMTGSFGSPWGMHTLGGGMLMFLFWGAILGGIALLVAGLARHRRGGDTPQGAQAAGRGESPMEILKRRYASGEIDREEFERMKELLSS